MARIDDVMQSTTHALLGMRGEPASAALAEQLVRRFKALDHDQQTTWFTFLLESLGPHRVRVDEAIARYQEVGGAVELSELADAVESLRQPMFRAMNTTPGGIAALLDIRTALLSRRKTHPDLAPVERDLGHLLRSWFNRGFLELRQLDWETPAHVLEKLIAYEAVHEIRGWDDLRRRLAPDRRSFGFFHPALPDEPIIFVEVALTRGMASSIQHVIDAPLPDDTPVEADTAIFYSITNCQTGLRGVSFGNFLIKQVTALLSSEMPQLTTFATLSPIPQFAEWLENNHPDVDTTNSEELAAWCARYLLGERSRGLPFDPVARFHLRNGARVERINIGGDLSSKGIRESHGVLVNYLYSDQDLAGNHECLVQDGIVISSDAVAGLADGLDPSLFATSPNSRFA